MGTQIIKSDYEKMIFTFRAKNVMVDYDLALLYEVPTKAMKQQVKRNRSRFPEDFMFELSKNEKNELVTICDRLSFLKHSSVNPLAFSEQGVSMLSSVLRSEKAIQINIEIMRAFARYRAIIAETNELKNQLNAMDKKFTQAFNYLLDRMDELHVKQSQPRRRIGFRPDDL
jgi:hypothetical protein